MFNEHQLPNPEVKAHSDFCNACSMTAMSYFTNPYGTSTGANILQQLGGLEGALSTIGKVGDAVVKAKAQTNTQTSPTNADQTAMVQTAMVLEQLRVAQEQRKAEQVQRQRRNMLIVGAVVVVVAIVGIIIWKTNSSSNAASPNPSSPNNQS